MPRVPVPEGYTEDTWLREQVHAGLRERFAGGTVPPEVTRPPRSVNPSACDTGRLSSPVGSVRPL